MTDLLRKIHEKQSKMRDDQSIIQRKKIDKAQDKIVKKYLDTMKQIASDIVLKLEQEMQSNYWHTFLQYIPKERLYSGLIDYINKYELDHNVGANSMELKNLREEYNSLEDVKQLINEDSQCVLEKVLKNPNYQLLMSQAANLERLIGFVGEELHPDLSRKVSQKKSMCSERL